MRGDGWWVGACDDAEAAGRMRMKSDEGNGNGFDDGGDDAD